jgi:hypothetical protein
MTGAQRDDHDDAAVSRGHPLSFLRSLVRRVKSMGDHVLKWSKE